MGVYTKFGHAVVQRDRLASILVDDALRRLLASARTVGAVRNSGTDVSLGSIRRENLPASIAAELRRRIQHGELEAGDRLPGHRELAAAFAVSVGSVREAISMLISEGLIETRAGLGTFVANGGRACRAGEVRPAALAQGGRGARRGSRGDRGGDRRAGGPASAAGAGGAPGEGRRAARGGGGEPPRISPTPTSEFHLALAEAAGNRYLLRALGDVRALLIEDMELAAEVGIRQFGSLGFSVDSHRQLVDAIASQDVERARDVLCRDGAAQQGGRARALRARRRRRPETSEAACPRELVLVTTVVGSYPQPDWLIDRGRPREAPAPESARPRAVARRAGAPRRGAGRRDACWRSATWSAPAWTS